MNRKRRFTIVVASIAVAAAIAIYYHFDPLGSPFAPKCVFYHITGLRCPGCGMQRALHSFLQGNIAEAIRYNYALAAVIPLSALYIISALMRHKATRLYKLLYSTPVLVALFCATLAWFAIRNILDV